MFYVTKKNQCRLLFYSAVHNFENLTNAIISPQYCATCSNSRRQCHKKVIKLSSNVFIFNIFPLPEAAMNISEENRPTGEILCLNSTTNYNDVINGSYCDYEITNNSVIFQNQVYQFKLDLLHPFLLNMLCFYIIGYRDNK